MLRQSIPKLPDAAFPEHGGLAADDARAGIFEHPNGNQEPAVVVFRGRHCSASSPSNDATRLSNELIDAVERPAC